MRELVDTAQAIIASATNDVPKEYMGKQIDSANKIFANPNTYNEQAISIQISNLKMYVNAFKAQSTAIADSKKQYDSIIAEAKDILASNTLPDYDSVQNMQQLIDQMESGRPKDPNSVDYINYVKFFQGNMDQLKKENADKAKKYAQEPEERAKAKAKLDRLQTPGSSTMSNWLTRMAT